MLFVILKLDEVILDRPIVRSFEPIECEFVGIGYWWSETQNRWDLERVTLFVVDYGLSLDDPKLERALGRLKWEITQQYANYGSQQEEIWLIAHQIARYV